ncbi:MAG: hypothetical protein V1838_00890 [Patescibacteria group bacterium]
MNYWPDNTIYFLTTSTFLHFPYFREYGQKSIVLTQLIKAQKRFNLSSLVYSIAINHYHVKFHLRYGGELAKIKQLINGGISYEYRRRFNSRYSEMWQSSRTIRVISEAMDWKVTGYIIGNLLKHKEVSTFNELKEDPFSSFKEIAEQCGEERARQLVYSVIEANEDSRGSLSIHSLEKLKVSDTPTEVG